jgi:hypothetical protein
VLFANDNSIMVTNSNQEELQAAVNITHWNNLTVSSQFPIAEL